MRGAVPARTSTGPLYELGAVARATGQPASLLKSWCEQRILVPAMEAKGTGTRRYFDRATVVRAAVLVELRRLLGTRLRLGEIGRWVATLEPGLIDRRRDPSPTWLVTFRDGDRLAETCVADAEGLARLVKQRSAVIALDLVTINQRLWKALEE